MISYPVQTRFIAQWQKTYSKVLFSIRSQNELMFIIFRQAYIHGHFASSQHTNRFSTSPHFPPPFTPPNLSSFTCDTTDEVSELLSQSPDTNCDLDPISTTLLIQCSHILLPTITNVINLSLSTGIFPDQFKNCYWPSFVFSSHTHFTIIHCHIMHANFYVIRLVSVYE